MTRTLMLALVLAAVSAARPAAAQDVWGWSVIIPSVTQTDVLGTMLRDQTRQREARQGQAPARAAPEARAAPPARATPAASPASLRFTPTAEARRENFARFVAARRGNGDAATAGQLEALLADPGFMPEIQREMRKRGLDTANMADAYTIWWIQAWQTAHGQLDDPSPAAIRAVKGQAERAMLTVPALTGAADAQKQAFAEGLLVQAAILGTATEQVKADPAQVRKLGGIARASARQIGVNLDAMRLTDAGFVDG